MVSWALIAVVVLFPLIQVPAVIYIGRYCKLREGEQPGRPPIRDFWTEREDEVTTERRREDPTVVDPAPHELTCPECGAKNDHDFRYCGECATSLFAAD